MLRIFCAFLFFLFFERCKIVSAEKEKKTCFGTSSKLSVGQDRLDHFTKMVQRYQNCTTVEGNLEITGLESANLDLYFLNDIEVVTGYVIIALNYVHSLSLDNLKLIRGRELYEGKFALYISVNYNVQDPNQRLELLRLSSLTEISRGSVEITSNSLCYVNAIEWTDILSPSSPRLGHNWTATIENQEPSDCGECHESCDGRCWGQGSDMCQILTRLVCDHGCQNTRCRGPTREECCDKECSSGCFGPTDRDCLVCRHVNDSGSCQTFCPAASIFDPQTERHIPNPDFKYHYRDRCVDKCPSNLLVEDNSCVKSCRIGHHNDGSGTCVPCLTGDCEKECFGVNHQDGPLASDQSVHANNIHYLKGCNIISGNLIFQSFAFKGDEHMNIPEMNVTHLRALKDIKNITGYLQIVSWHKSLHNFSAFENLRFIGGVDLYRKVLSLVITSHNDYLSQITSLGFHSLRTIAHGNVYISKLKNLCFADSIDWSDLIRDPVERKGFSNGTKIRLEKNCSVKCDPQCSSMGCWGPGPGQCVLSSCKNVSYNGICMSGCKKELGIYLEPGETICRDCNPQCKLSCVGEGPQNCTECRHYRDNGTCVTTCPFDKYGDPRTRECLPCNSTCTQHQHSRMCSGPNSTLGIGGCNYCEYAITTQTLKAHRCLPPGSTCPPAHFTNSKFTSLNPVNHTCVPCYEGCTNCSGYTKKDCNHPLPSRVSKATIVVAVVVPIIFIAFILVITAILCRNRRKAIERQRQYSMRALGIDTMAEEQSTDHRARLMEPMTPSGVAPNQAQLRIVKEAELRIGKILGSGAFGTVHRGYWIPDMAPKERVKVPVAIKVLRDESSQVASKEILDEAFLMASCEHPYLVRILGISLAQEIMLITQLMPLGNLLDYVRENKDNIASQHLLNWSLQIAKGMCYLAEEKHLVHRDLAARNVLVKSPNHVRITDFGLAKLLDVNEDVYKAEGGKMPIKWLALESIQQRIFTQKSDVWSFGVTMWELMTFGKRPYENVPAREVHTLLERGQRLHQPSICTIDIYMLLIKCWTVDMEARPTFKELTEELSRMARDPPRYIVIDNEGLLTDLPSPTNSEFLRSLMNEEGDDFPITDAEEYLHQPAADGRGRKEALNGRSKFPLEPAPSTVRWKRHQEDSLASTSSQQPLLGNRSGDFGWRHRQSNQNDSRHDSVMTMMTNLSTFSEPNGSSSPFAFDPNALDACPEVVLGPDNMPMDGFEKHSKPLFKMGDLHGDRTLSDSSDVFAPQKQTPNRTSNGCSPLDHPMSRLPRPREDSTTLRYSAEPVARIRQQQQQTKQNADSEDDNEAFISQDEEGYLTPCEAANRMPEYLDPDQMPNYHPSHKVASKRSPLIGSSLTNPEYDSNFSPADIQDGACYVDPGAKADPNTEYQNLFPDTSHPYSRPESSSSEECKSDKQDSGVQSGDETDKPKTAVSNPNYESLDDAHTQLETCNSADSNYVNTAIPQPTFNFSDDDIFNANQGFNTKISEDERTYFEPDSGVGIDVAMDNVLYHKFPSM